MTRRQQTDVIRDPEVLNFLRDDPELLAIADAVHATLGVSYRQRQRRLRVARAASLIVAASAAVVLLLVEPWASSPSLVDRALAAVPAHGPVIHARLRTRIPGEELVDLASGRTVPEISELEFWFDVHEERLHTLIRRDGEVVGDILSTPRRAVSAAGAVLGARSRASVNPMLVGFATGYREALTGRTAQPSKRGRTPSLQIRTSFGVQVVQLDSESFLPLAIRASDGHGRSVTAVVAQLEMLPIAAANFQAPKPVGATAFGGKVAESRLISLSAAQHSLSFQALWAGESPQGLRLSEIHADRLARLFPRGSGKSSAAQIGLDLIYGATARGRPDWQRAFLEIQQAATPEPAYGYLPEKLRLAPIPPPGRMRVERRELSGSLTGAVWVGYLRQGSSFLTVTASSRSLLIFAARHLVPIRR